MKKRKAVRKTHLDQELENSPVKESKNAELMRAFQSNLLSLISHELRTPLTGILNALTLLEEGAGDDFGTDELVEIAKRNARHLEHTLASLLDVAALESGTFKARLKEIDFSRLALRRIATHAKSLSSHKIKFQIETRLEGQSQTPVLADYQKFGRALDLCFDVLTPMASEGTEVRILIGPTSIEFTLIPKEEELDLFLKSMKELGENRNEKIGLEVISAFIGTVRSERDFLTRTKEGLGSELVLIDEIMRAHSGKFSYQLSQSSLLLRLELPELSHREALKSVIVSRAYEASTGLGSVAIAVIAVPQKALKKDPSTEQFRNQIRECLFRSTDAVYSLPGDQQVVIIMNDCKLGDGPGLIRRIEKLMGISLQCGLSACPEEGSDPDILLDLAVRRLSKPLVKS